jgi:photosystem II stability/assembly factor-like uncharacterized protein
VANDPAHPDHLLAWTQTSGLYQSVDRGTTWSLVSTVPGDVYNVLFAGNLTYVASDSGLYVSDTSGMRFHVADPNVLFSSISFCATAPEQGYGVVGTAVERTSDGGETWRATQPLTGFPSLVAADPENPDIAYVGFFYPLELMITTDGGQHWHSLLAASS